MAHFLPGKVMTPVEAARLWLQLDMFSPLTVHGPGRGTGTWTGIRRGSGNGDQEGVKGGWGLCLVRRASWASSISSAPGLVLCPRLRGMENRHHHHLEKWHFVCFPGVYTNAARRAYPPRQHLLSGDMQSPPHFSSPTQRQPQPFGALLSSQPCRRQKRPFILFPLTSLLHL